MKYIYLFTALLLASTVFSQPALPVISATSKHVTISDDGFVDKNAWRLSPDVRPDVFTADRSRKTKWVIFYTDIDSIKIKLKPGATFNFIILLNGKDSCYTQVASAPGPENTSKSLRDTHDTIPFTLTAYNAIHVAAVINDTDTLQLHFDTGSFDFRITRDAILKKTSLLSNQPAALAGTVKPDYNKLNKVVKLQMGNMVWHHPVVLPTEITAHEMDGKFGWSLFEGKAVEINYDNNLLIIHSKRPAHLKGYTKSKLAFIRSFPCAKGIFSIEHKKHPAWFLLDTGSDQAVLADSGWAARLDFSEKLPLIKSSAISDPRGNKYETKLVLAPLFTIGHNTFTSIPVYVLGGKNPVRFEINYLGNDLLKRFNMILDFKNDYLYLKPNKLMSVPFREKS